jgi:hypothetical protein
MSSRKRPGVRSDPTHERAFASDTPLKEPSLDRFKRHPCARRVAKTLAVRSDPSSIVVLIHGAWGEGKTTVLEFIERELHDFDHVVPVKFNPWRVTDEASLLFAFFATLAAALDKPAKTVKEKLGDAFRKYGDIAGELNLNVHGIKLSAGKAITKVGEALSTTTLDEERERIEKLLAKTGTRVVVFLDDIDRLDQEEAQAVFKLLKLTANFTNLSYILAFDRDIVAGAIGARYGVGDDRAGYEYLGKIVQVNLSLPLADKDVLTSLCVELLEVAITDAGLTLTAEQRREFELVFLQYIAPDLTTPRTAKLYANAVSFTLPLLADEVNLVDLLLLEALKCFHPSLHEDLRKHAAMYTGTFGWEIDIAINGSARCKADLEFQLKRLPEAAAGRARYLLTTLFPQLHELFRSGKYGNISDDRAALEQRVRLPDYLKRYLTCSIPSGDLSDREIDSYLSSVPSMSAADIESEYRSLLKPGQELPLLLKLKTRLPEVLGETQKSVCFAIAHSGALLRNPPNGLGQLRSTAALLMREFIGRLPSDEREQLAIQIVSEAQPLEFAGTCFGWMQLMRNENESERVFSPAVENKVRDVLGNRIAREEHGACLLTGQANDFIPLFRIWQETKGSSPVRTHITKCLSQRPEDAVLLLAPFGNPGQTVITQQGYDELGKFVAPDDLQRALESRGLLHPDCTDPAARLAKSFTAIHNAQKSVPTGIEA